MVIGNNGITYATPRARLRVYATDHRVNDRCDVTKKVGRFPGQVQDHLGKYTTFGDPAPVREDAQTRVQDLGGNIGIWNCPRRSSELQ